MAYIRVVRSIIFPLLILLLQSVSFAQAPEKLSYQAVIRDDSNGLVHLTTVSMQISVLKGSVSGEVIYQEEQMPKTNDNGLVSIEIGGALAQVLVGDFSSIPWGNDSYFIKIVSTLPSGDIMESVSQLVSVPYALHAKTAEQLVGEAGVIDLSLYAKKNMADENIVNLADPVHPKDAVNKAYVDALLERVQLIEGEKIKDADGHLYPSVKVGDQVWMAENLRTTKYRNGDPIPLVSDDASWSTLKTGAYCDFDNMPAANTAWGKLYNFYAVVDDRHLCPAGWHVPTDDEWTTLELYLQNNGFNYDDSTDTDQIRMTNNKVAKVLGSSSEWMSSTKMGAVGNTDFSAKRNQTSFAAFPSGGRYDNGHFTLSNLLAIWWTSSLNPYEIAWNRFLYFDEPSMIQGSSDKKNGASVRCLMD